MGLSHGFRLVALWRCSCFNYRRDDGHDDAAAAATTASHRNETRRHKAKQGSSAAAPQRIQITYQSSNNQLTCGVSDVRNVRVIIITFIIFLIEEALLNLQLHFAIEYSFRVSYNEYRNRASRGNTSWLITDQLIQHVCLVCVCVCLSPCVVFTVKLTTLRRCGELCIRSLALCVQ